MARTIVTHVGTSLLTCGALMDHDPFTDTERKSLDKPDSFNRHGKKWLPDVIACLSKSLTRHWEADAAGAARRRASPGEIASLSALWPRSGVDTVILLHSDTEQGRFCAEVLRVVLATLNPGNGFPHCEPVSKQVDGLKIEEANATVPAQARQEFVRFGLANYVRIAWKEYDQLSQQLENANGDKHELIFNVTGGYKGTVPIARDLALLLSGHALAEKKPVECSLCYLFENSPQMIWYGAYPVTVEWGDIPIKMLRAAERVEGIASKDAVPSRYFEPVPGLSDRRQPSALGIVLLELHGYVGP